MSLGFFSVCMKEISELWFCFGFLVSFSFASTPLPECLCLIDQDVDTCSKSSFLGVRGEGVEEELMYCG